MADVQSVALNAAKPIIESLGFEAAGVDYCREEGQMCLTFYICREGGVTIDDCETVSKAIEDAVDTADPTDGKPYCLCVSTWGDRPLTVERDFERNIGVEVEVKLKKSDSGKKKKLVGVLKAFDEKSVTVEIKKDGITVLDKNNIETVRPYIGF